MSVFESDGADVLADMVVVLVVVVRDVWVATCVPDAFKIVEQVWYRRSGLGIDGIGFGAVGIGFAGDGKVEGLGGGALAMAVPCL